MTTKTELRCAHCSRAFQPGVSWVNINYCRAALLVEFIKEHPGLTAWEISQRLNLLYGDIQKGLQKGREYGLFVLESEEREQGGIRYRYTIGLGVEKVIAEWAARRIL